MITMKAMLLYRPGEACGLLGSIFQPTVQACGSFRSCFTFRIQEYSLSLQESRMAIAMVDRIRPTDLEGEVDKELTRS